jgi:multimeric flavodoxin WrbA
MRTMVLHGSPRKNGNSDTLAAHFIEGLNASADSEVKHFYTNDLNVRPCQGCLSCNTPPHDCTTEDDMQEIYAAYKAADVVVFATPMYWGYMTAQLKAVVDRMEAVASKRYFEGKTFVVIATYHHHVESTVAFFERIIGYFGGELHVITCCTLDQETGRDIPVSNLTEKLDEAYGLGERVGQRTSPQSGASRDA